MYKFTFCIDQIIFKIDNGKDNQQLHEIYAFFGLQFVDLNVM